MQAALGSGDSTREAQLLETWKAYKRGFQQGLTLFNVKPKKGIAYLQVCQPLFSFNLRHRILFWRPFQSVTPRRKYTVQSCHFRICGEFIRD